MARKKISEDSELLNFDELDTAEANEEAEELELSEEEDSEEEETLAKPAKKTPRPKAQTKKEPLGLAAQLLKNSGDSKPEPELPSRAKKAKEEFEETVAEEAPEVKLDSEEVSEEETPAKKVRRPRSSPEEKGLSVAMESALEAMSSHWTKAKEATDALVSNLERVKKDLEEVKQSSSEPLQMLVNQTKEKQAVASRVTFALSLAAMIFSFVSLTLSQSVRGQLLGLTQAAPMHQQVAQTAPVRPAAPASVPSAPVLNPIPDPSKSLARIPRKAAPRIRK